MVFHWSLSDSKSPQISSTILADLNNAVVWTVSTCPLISKSLYQPFGDCVERPNYNWCYRDFHVPQFFQVSGRVLVFILLFAFLQFYAVVSRNGKIHFSAGSLFCWQSFGLLCEFFAPALAITGVWVTASFLKSQGSASVYWLILNAEVCMVSNSFTDFQFFQFTSHCLRFLFLL